MKRVLIVTAAAAAAGVVALAGTGAAQQPGEQTLTFYESENAGTYAFTDVRPLSKYDKHGEPTRISPGDGFVLTIPLFSDTARKTRVGKIFGECHATETPKGSFDKSTMLCHGVVRINRSGTLTITGTIVGEAAPTFAVDGGTGAYEGARGTFSSKHAKPGDIDTIHLLP
jgi:hypothetical protein